MKTIKIITLALIASLSFSSCSDDDDNPEPVNEEEVITTANITLTPTSGGDAIVLSSRDLDGADGPDAPDVTGGTLAANTTYTASIELLNEIEDPAEDVTLEIEEEDEDHQFFFTTTLADTTFSYTDEDEDGYPIGLSFSVTTGESAMGTITISLVHEPNKSASGVEDGDISNTGGETELVLSFPITIE